MILGASLDLNVVKEKVDYYLGFPQLCYSAIVHAPLQAGLLLCSLIPPSTLINMLLKLAGSLLLCAMQAVQVQWDVIITATRSYTHLRSLPSNAHFLNEHWNLTLYSLQEP